MSSSEIVVLKDMPLDQHGVMATVWDFVSPYVDLPGHTYRE